MLDSLNLRNSVVVARFARSFGKTLRDDLVRLRGVQSRTVESAFGSSQQVKAFGGGQGTAIWVLMMGIAYSSLVAQPLGLVSPTVGRGRELLQDCTLTVSQ